MSASAGGCSGWRRAQTFVPQSYAWGSEAQVDWYEAWAELGGERVKLQVFCMRSMASGAAFHRAYPRATQQAFLEAHEHAFAYFGGVLGPALRQPGQCRAQGSARPAARGDGPVRRLPLALALRGAVLHPAAGTRRAGSRARTATSGATTGSRSQAADLETLNRRLLAACRADERRVLDGRDRQLAGDGARAPSPAAGGGGRLRPGRAGFPVVNAGGCIGRHQRLFGAAAAGTKVQASLHAAHLEVWHGGRCVARHERCHSRRQQILDLDHYLDVLERKPGAMAGCKPLEQWRRAGRWPAAYDVLWQRLNERHGRQDGTRAMIGVILLGRAFGHAACARR